MKFSPVALNNVVRFALSVDQSEEAAAFSNTDVKILNSGIAMTASLRYQVRVKNGFEIKAVNPSANFSHLVANTVAIPLDRSNQFHRILCQ